MAHWSFRGDDEIDPFISKWAKKSEKSFHIRQALRMYLFGERTQAQQLSFKQIEFEFKCEKAAVPEQLSFDDWR